MLSRPVGSITWIRTLVSQNNPITAVMLGPAKFVSDFSLDRQLLGHQRLKNLRALGTFKYEFHA